MTDKDFGTNPVIAAIDEGHIQGREAVTAPFTCMRCNVHWPCNAIKKAREDAKARAVVMGIEKIKYEAGVNQRSLYY